jgi:hypothetical protein
MKIMLRRAMARSYGNNTYNLIIRSSRRRLPACALFTRPEWRFAGAKPKIGA